MENDGEAARLMEIASARKGQGQLLAILRHLMEPNQLIFKAWSSVGCQVPDKRFNTARNCSKWP